VGATWNELDPFGRRANPFKTEFTELLNLIGEAAYRFATMEEQLKQIIKLTTQKTHGGVLAPGELWIRLNAHTSQGNNKWTYTWNEMSYTTGNAWDPVTGGLQDTSEGYAPARNLAEFPNSATHALYGIELSTVDYTLTVLPMTIIFRPVVRARLERDTTTQNLVPWFEATNPTSIACPSP
jgi:hypothetical protein